MAKDNESIQPVQSASDTASEKKCLRCKKPNAQDAKYCKHCGNLLLERECKHCAEQNDQDAQYCKQCGKQLHQTLYDKFGPKVEIIKIILQMLVGVILTCFIIIYIGYYAFQFIITRQPQSALTDGSILAIVGVALAISTAFELAYTLFTDGPDEAVNPIITGIAAGILILISLKLDFSSAGAVAVLTLALVVLFILKEFFIEKKNWIDRLVGKPPSETTNQNNNTNDAS